MPAEDFFTPTDLDALRMESELLTLENRFLKGRILVLEQELHAARQREQNATRELAKAKRDAAA